MAAIKLQAHITMQSLAASFAAHRANSTKESKAMPTQTTSGHIQSCQTASWDEGSKKIRYIKR